MKLLTWAKAHKKIIAASVAAILLIGGGAGAVAFVGKVDPQTDLDNAIAKSLSPSSAANKMTVDYTYSNGMKASIVITGGTTSSASQYKAQLEVKTGVVDVKLTAEVHFEVATSTLYVKLPNSPMLSGFAPELGALMSQAGDDWIKISPEYLAGNTVATNALACISAVHTATLQRADEQPLRDLLKQYPYARVTGELPNETILGEPTRHYKVALNSSNEGKLYSEAGKLQSFAALDKACRSTFAELEKSEVTPPADAPMVYTSETNDYWVGKSTGKVHKAATSMKTDLFTANITMETVYTKLTLVKPSSAIDASELEYLLAEPTDYEETISF